MNIKKQILQELSSNAAWQVRAAERFWICPFCGDVGAGWAPAKKMLPEVREHIEEKCPHWDGARGTLLPMKTLRERAEECDIRNNIGKDPLWRIVDGRRVWYCPVCALPTRVRLNESKKFDAAAIRGVREHLVACRRRNGQVLRELGTLLIARGLCAQAEWKFFTRSRRWVCPFCLSVTEAQVGEARTLTPELLGRVEAHLGDCYRYKDRKPAPKPAAAVKSVRDLEDGIDEWMGKVVARMDSDPVWNCTAAEKTWICPFCRTPVREIQFTSEFVRKENCPRQIAEHLTAHCEPCRRGQAPAASADGLLQAVAPVKPAAPEPAAPTGLTPDKSDVYRQLTEQIQDLRSEVAGSKELERSLDEARKMQLQMLPQKPEIEGFEFVTIYRPCQKVGGDFYDFIRLSDRHLGVAIGDVSGHGMEAAIVMSMAKKALKIHAKLDTDPVKVLVGANQEVRGELSPNTFITVGYGVLDTIEKRFVFARAGHNPVMLANQKRDPPVQVFQPSGMALGIAAPERFDSVLEPHGTELRSGDLVLQFTDGLTEAVNASGEEFGMERLMEALHKGAGHEAEYVSYLVDSALSKFTDGMEQEDDITIIAFVVR